MNAALLRAFAPGRLALFGNGHEPLRLATLSVALERGVTLTLAPQESGGLVVERGMSPAATAAASSAEAATVAARLEMLLEALPSVVAPLGLAAPIAALHGTLAIDSALPESWDAGATAATAVALLELLMSELGRRNGDAAGSARWREPRRLGELAGALLAASGHPADRKSVV